MVKFKIEKNIYLHTETNGYYDREYLGHGVEGNPDFLTDFKNTFNNTFDWILEKAKDKAKRYLIRSLSQIITEEGLTNPICIVVPRSKAFISEKQQYFKLSVSEACKEIGNVEDGTDVIIRIKDTYTTHLEKAKKMSNYANLGERPRPNITKDTCKINRNKIGNREIILVDDIYTKTVNIDEDCIQTLYDYGAKKVVLYAIAKTRSKYEI